MRTVGIIGYSKFSNLLGKLFLEFDPNIVVKYSSRSKTIVNLEIFNLSEVANSDIVIPCVPISAFEETILKIRPHLKTGSVVIDVCSVKVYPRDLMIKYLPQDINKVSTHPNFGPESYRLNNNSTNNLNFIIKNIDCEESKFNWILSWLKFLKVNIVEMECEYHDENIGVPHFLSMFLGILLSKTNVKRTQFGASSTQRMFDMAEGVGNDIQILLDMVKFNPFAKNMLKILDKKYIELFSELNK